MLAFITGLATFFLAPAGTFGLASMARTPTGVGFGVTFAATFVELRLSRRWRGFAIDFDDENLAIIGWGLSVFHIGPAIVAHADDEMLERFT